MSATISVAATGNPRIDGVLLNEGWAGSTITYRFPTSETEYQSILGGFYTFTGFQAFNAVQQATALDAMQMISDYTGLTFRESSATNVNLRLAEAIIVDGAFTGTAFAYSPNTASYAGDAFFNTADYNTPASGDYAYLTILHEIGHAMGLAHGHEDSADEGGYGALPNAFDSLEYSAMTYRSSVNTVLDGSGYTALYYPETYMMSDIAALQHIYGANFQTNSGNDTYVFAPGDGTSLSTIWDGGGNDTYDFSDYTTGIDIDLNPGEASGAFSGNEAILDFTNGTIATGIVYNSFLYQGDERSLIENAIGGSGDDIIFGNSADNTISGGLKGDLLYGNQGNDTLLGENGDDFLTGGLGNDVLDGGNGVDTADYSGASSSTTVILFGRNGITQQTVSSGRDTLTDVENIVGSSFNDRLIGDTVSNELFGGAGNDTLDGAAGNDFLYGEEGNDGFRARGGTDTFDGGVGIDYINYDATTGVNVFLDSSYGTNARGAAYDTLTQIENIIGSATGNDLIYGDDNSNRLSGSGGNDTLRGLGGIDQLEGGGGDDLLIGDQGSDIIVTGTGADTVWFQQSPGGGERDRITDFEAGVDTLRIDASVFGGGLSAGDTVLLQLADSVTGTTVNTNEATFLYDTSGSGFLYFDADGNGSGAAELFVWLQNMPTLTSDDFEIVA